jgi:hypothetical protein
MKTKFFYVFLFLLISTGIARSQEHEYAISTVLGSKGIPSSGGYGAISNKFTSINGQHANLVEVYGGWYINHKFLLGVAFAGVTNDIPVPERFSALPGTSMSYEYGQAGLMTEYVLASHKAVHLAFQLFSGAGFTVQYLRHSGEQNYPGNDHFNQTHHENWFFVAEPGIKLEVNVLPWIRFSPGVSYRAAFHSKADGLSDNALTGASYNLTLKFGKF